MDTNTENITDQDLINIVQEKESALDFREHRHEAWNDNYTLYRDKVILNRLTQRQTINVPLMKYGIQTVMKDIDEMPSLYFSNLSNNQQKEIYYNEYWDVFVQSEKLKIKDRVDKKQACLYGRTFKKLNIVNGKPSLEVIDPQDMLVDRFVDPSNLDTARCVIQIGIYRSLKSIVENEDYSDTERARLQAYYGEYQAQLLSESANDQTLDRNQRLENMGVVDVNDPTVGATLIELNEVYRKEYNTVKDCEEIIFYVTANLGSQTFKLYKKPLHEHIGETSDDYWYDHYIYDSWSTDPERIDFWSDAPSDTLRQLNKALNTWISQLVENRQLRNFNMHYYDSSNPAFVPQTFQPVPWAWFPVAGNPNEVIKDVTVGDLSESLDEIQFVISLGEKAIATSSAQTGAIEQKSVTLGEVQLALANAQERIKSMALYYNESWLNIGRKYVKMVEGAFNLLEPVKSAKKGRTGKKMWTKEISPSDWYDKNGYEVEITMKEDKDAEDSNAIQKLGAVKEIMQDNEALNDIYKKKLLEFAGLSADEMKEVLDYEKQKALTVMNPVIDQGMNQGMQNQNVPSVPEMNVAPQAPQVI